jgi:hypothetical protein
VEPHGPQRSPAEGDHCEYRQGSASTATGSGHQGKP